MVQDQLMEDVAPELQDQLMVDVAPELQEQLMVDVAPEVQEGELADAARQVHLVEVSAELEMPNPSNIVPAELELWEGMVALTATT
jgi:hypothetical protein